MIRYDRKGQVVHKTSPYEDPLNTPPEEAQYYRQNAPFLGYSPSTDGKPLKGTPVYVNYGRTEDYDYLTKIGVNVSGHVAIAKYGKIFRGDIVKQAQDNGAIGAIIYCDPYDYTDGNPDNTYPHSIYMPSSGVQRGTIREEGGDPETPNYPSIGINLFALVN